MFAMESIGSIMPIENEMDKPQHFLGCPGALNCVMTAIIMLYGGLGFLGYVKYGDAVEASITLSLPEGQV